MPATDKATELKRLLIVEDTPDVLRSYYDLLEDPRVRIEVATNGIQALAKMRELRPHAVLLDVWLPGMDGFEIFRTMKKDAELAATRVIFVSAHSAPGALMLAKDLGAYAWLRKPFSETLLQRKVLEALDLEATPPQGTRFRFAPGEARNGQFRATPIAAPRPSDEPVPSSADAETVNLPPAPHAAPHPAPAAHPVPAAPAAEAAPAQKAPRGPAPVIGPERSFILLISPARYTAGIQRRIESVGARVVVAPDLQSAVSHGRSPLVDAVVIVEPLADMTIPAFVEYLAAHGLSAPLVHLTGGARQHPRLLTLARLFTATELKTLLKTLERHAKPRPQQPPGPDDETMRNAKSYLGF